MALGILSLVYLLCALLLILHALGTAVLLLVYWRTRHQSLAPPPVSVWPRVAVQLPVYNERHVIERLLAAVAALDYPRQCLKVQVLDDSSDETSAIIRRMLPSLRAQGLDIQHLQRAQRRGYKAGALAEGLAQLDCDLVAVLDADFVPPPDFLRRTVPHLVADEGIGMVQTRWGHLNWPDNALTRGQALALDGHFIVEQTARNRAGWFINFSGSGGVWRRSCILEAGGWSALTLTEDLDLSYRAQLAGWRFLYLPDVVVPAEVPPQMAAWKQQQARWARGSTRTLIGLLLPLWRAPLPPAQRIMATLHLCQYLPHPLMLLMLLLTPLLLPGRPAAYAAAGSAGAGGAGAPAALRAEPVCAVSGLAATPARLSATALAGHGHDLQRDPGGAGRSRRGGRGVSSHAQICAVPGGQPLRPAHRPYPGGRVVAGRLCPGGHADRPGALSGIGALAGALLSGFHPGRRPQPARPVAAGAPAAVTRLAILADIHGNLPALEAVIADMAGEEFDQVVVAGDLINGAPFSRQVLERVFDLGWLAIRGNHELLFLDHLAEGPGKSARRDSQWALEMTAEQLGDHWRARIATMPDELTLRFADAPPLRILHGSAGNPFRTINRHTDEREARTLLSGVQEKSVVTAHCHLHFERRLAGRQIFNPGSVGAPLDGRTSAGYMLLKGDDCGWRAEFRRVPVDVGPLVAEFRRLDVEGRWGAEGYLLVEQSPPVFELSALARRALSGKGRIT